MLWRGRLPGAKPLQTELAGSGLICGAAVSCSPPTRLGAEHGTAPWTGYDGTTITLPEIVTEEA
jgi:hypothetical protein